MTIAIGLMSGTSMDGIDAAMLRTDGVAAVERGPSLSLAYDAAFRRRIGQALIDARAIARRDERPGILAEVERELTLRHAQAVRALVAAAPAGWKAVDLVGFHGQTVLHRPAAALTVQLGDGKLLARETGLPVVYDMRANDMAHGGQGAPLVPAYHSALAASLPPPFAGRLPLVFVNIGGISNITYVAGGGDPVAFDTGPGNALIDQWMAREAGVPYDAGGAVAGEGTIVQAVLDRYLENPFFARRGAKSLDRADFSLDLADGLELADGARTLAALTAEAVMRSAALLPAAPRLWIVAGGGRRNGTVIADMRRIAAAGGAEVALAEEVELDGSQTEAEAWAYLAVRSSRGLPLTFPTTTGCRAPVTGGVRADP